jgi:hypothetical protein
VPFVLTIVVLRSVHRIGPAQVGLVTRRFAVRKLADDNPVAFHGEAGHQADLGGSPDGAGADGARAIEVSGRAGDAHG